MGRLTCECNKEEINTDDDDGLEDFERNVQQRRADTYRRAELSVISSVGTTLCPFDIAYRR